MKPTPGLIILSLVMAALGAAAWWGGTELTEPAVQPIDMELAARAFAAGKKLGQVEALPECVKIRIDRSDDPAAGYREVMGETVEKEWIRTITICPEAGGSISYDGKGTYFLDPEAD